MRYIAAIALILVALPALCEQELYRIRIANRKGGLVQVSTDGGAMYSTVGRVLHPANTRITGFAAASYTPHGAVAATAVHGLRIKTGRFAQGVGKAQMPLIFSVVPLEFASIPSGYGGHIPRSSGILTDIFAGRSIFRNLAPYSGSRVYLEQGRALAPLPEDYDPLGGEVFVIAIQKPDQCPLEVEFENKVGGKVTARYGDGSSEVIADVVRPVIGVGRYDGTTFTGVGSINTNHGGVITISTAPVKPPRTQEGGAVETRGGFMVQPLHHVQEQQEGAPQVMVIGSPRIQPPLDPLLRKEGKQACPPYEGGPQGVGAFLKEGRGACPPYEEGPQGVRLEGVPPLFFGCIDLTRYPRNPEKSARVQVSIDGGPWEDPPEMVGKINDAWTPAYLTDHFTRSGKPREVTQGLTAFRLLLPERDPKLIADDLQRESADYTARALHSGAKSVKGSVTLKPRKTPPAKSVVTIYIDGVPISTSNQPPYSSEWETTRFPNGFHEIRIESRPPSAREPIVEIRDALVVN